MNTQTTETEAPHTNEEKFFGVKTSINDMRPSKQPKDDKDEDKPQIEIEEESQTVQEAAPQAKKPEEEEKPAVKSEPDTDDELEGYSEKVQKRINKLTWQANEEKRQREKSEQLRDEAINYARQVNQQNQQQAQLIATGEASLVEQIKSRAELAVKSARSEYRTVYEEGNAEKIIAAQEALNLAQAELLEADRYDRDYQQRVQNWAAQQEQQRRYVNAQPQPQPQRQQPVVPKPTPEAADWTTKNPWFGKAEHRDMTAIAYATHEKLVRDDGIQPDTDEYYRQIDSTMRLRFPEYFKASDGQGQTNTARPATVVAPGSRNNGGKPRTVKLKPSQVKLAKKLGITLEDYAAQVLKGE